MDYECFGLPLINIGFNLTISDLHSVFTNDVTLQKPARERITPAALILLNNGKNIIQNIFCFTNFLIIPKGV